MGFNFTWCAFRAEQADVLLERLGIKLTGITDETPDAPLCLARLETGWWVLWCNEDAREFLSPKAMPALSRGAEVVLGQVSEFAMGSSTELWSGGKRRWWVYHLGDNGPRGLATKGRLPSTFPAIKAEMEEMQRAVGGDEAGVDYIFEIPLLVAEELVGFKHDCYEGLFEVVEREAPQRGGGFLQWLTGRR